MATIPLTEVDPQPVSVEPQAISVEEYLHTAYSPDCDYVDGVIEERNLGEYEHSRLQTKLITLFATYEIVWQITTLPECRLQVSIQRFRIPDLMILRKSQKVDRIVREAPLLCIEILSPADTWTKMRARLNDYVALGVENLWCFDPDAREARVYTATGLTLVTTPDLTIPNTPIRLSLAEVFSVLD